MRWLTSLCALAVLAVPTALMADEPADLPPCPSQAEKPDVARLIQRIQRLLEGTSSTAVMTMTIRTPTWSRTLKLQTWAKGRDLALVRVLEGGPRDTGMMTLKRDKQLWNWLPQAARVMKLPSAMLGDGWMGSDLTNDDLVRGTSLVDDFDAKVTGIAKLASGDAWNVVLTAKPNAPTVWGKLELQIDRARCLPVLERFFDEDGKPVRTLQFSDFRTAGWRHFPAKTTVIPEAKGRETVLQYLEFQFDVAIPDDTFSLQRLRQGR
ncbi:MAG: outer membrane lipoprotein-sorting protein [Deltaproteobacteria bacterium]|nr:outer membrane lipoprotein-sorting protein [Deltaproteobacteria bacterium]